MIFFVPVLFGIRALVALAPALPVAAVDGPPLWVNESQVETCRVA